MDVAAGGGRVVVSGRPVTIVVVVLFTETIMSHSTPVVILYLASDGVPSSSMEKPPLKSRLAMKWASVSRPAISRRLMRAMGVGVWPLRKGMNPLGAGTVTVDGMDVVVVVKVVVTFTVFVKVVAAGVTVTVSRVVYLKLKVFVVVTGGK